MYTNTATQYIKAQENKHQSEIWKFSVLDKACLPMVIRGTWIFNSQPDIELMKEGLKKLLNYYPHLSGRMKEKDNSGIHLTNDGVPFSVANEQELLISDINQKDDIIKNFSIKITPSNIKRGIDAPLSIKITKLKDGYVLGIQCSHACMDGNSFYTMVYNWAQICKKEDFEKPVLDQSFIPSPENFQKEQVMKSAIESGWKQLSILSLFKLLPLLILGKLKGRSDAFYISAHEITKLKQKISDECGFKCTANVALSSFISKMLIKLFGHTEDTKCTQVTVVNVRGRLADMPKTFVGNASIVFKTNPFLAGSSVDEIAKIIHHDLKPILETPSQEVKNTMLLNINVMNQKLPLAPFDVIAMNSKKPTVVYINNFSKLHIYDINFGSGIPGLVIPHNLGDQVVIWPAPPAKGGVEVYFSGIPAHAIRKLSKGDSWLSEMERYRQN